MTTLYLRPTAAGDETNLTPYGATYNWDCVDETPADDWTTNVCTNYTVDYKRDLYNFEDTAQTGTINWIKVWMRGSSNATNLGRGKTAIKTEGTVYDGAENVLSMAGWANFSTQYTTNPSTGLAWTWTQLNALQAGVSLKGFWQPPATYAYCTQVYVEVDYTLIIWEKSISDMIVIADSLSKAISVPRSNIIVIADSAIYINTEGGIGFHSAVNQRRYKSVEFDTFTFPDPAGVGFSSANDGYYLIAGLGVVSPAVKNVGLFRTDSLAIDDIINKAIALNKADSISIADVFSKVSGFNRSIIDSVAIADVLVKEYGLTRTDSIAIGDVLAKAIGLVRADLLTIADLAIYLKSISLFLSDTITITDGETKVIGKNLADLIIITDGEVPIGALFVPPGIYQIEVHDTDGSLVAVLEKSYEISLEEKANAPKVLTFTIPADESKLTYITRARELWVRDVENDVVIAKTKLLRKEDVRD